MILHAFLSRINTAHPWSHNDAFTRFVVRNARAVRRGGGHVAVDVGCGTGNMLARLASVFGSAIGIEPDLDTAAIATRRFIDSKVQIDARKFGDEASDAYDLILFVASLHHMDLRSSLIEVRGSLRPGGRLVVVGIARETPIDVVHSAVSSLLNPIVGLLRHPTRATRPPQHMRAPIAEPILSFDEIRSIARSILPGIQMRRRLFWRYTAVWVAPAS